MCASNSTLYCCCNSRNEQQQNWSFDRRSVKKNTRTVAKNTWSAANRGGLHAPRDSRSVVVDLWWPTAARSNKTFERYFGQIFNVPVGEIPLTRNYVAGAQHYYWMCVNARALPFILLHTHTSTHTRTRRDTIYYLYFISLLRAQRHRVCNRSIGLCCLLLGTRVVFHQRLLSISAAISIEW